MDAICTITEEEITGIMCETHVCPFCHANDQRGKCKVCGTSIPKLDLSSRRFNGVNNGHEDMLDEAVYGIQIANRKPKPEKKIP